MANINPRLAGYRAGPTLAALPSHPRFHRRHVRRVVGGSLPVLTAGPRAVGVPASGWTGISPPGPKDDNSASWNRVTAGYFDVIGTPIIKGRGISEQDTAASRHVAVVNETFARNVFQERRSDRQALRPDGRETAVNSKWWASRKMHAMWPSIWISRFAPSSSCPKHTPDYTQTNLGSLFLRDIVILTRPGASLSIAAVRQAMASVDPGMPIISIRTLERASRQSVHPAATDRSPDVVLRDPLAGLGVDWAVRRDCPQCRSPRREIGLRMALGANRAHVVGLVVRGAFGLILLGLLIGLPLTFAVGRFLSTQLYGTSPYNPVVILAAVVALGLSALVASFVPALRASTISPLDALRNE